VTSTLPEPKEKALKKKRHLFVNASVRKTFSKSQLHCYHGEQLKKISDENTK
jgi:hypothetical protein